MIISRYKYDLALKEAYEKGRVEAEEYYWQQERERRILERMDNLEGMLRKHCEPTEGGSFENATCADAHRPIPKY